MKKFAVSKNSATFAFGNNNKTQDIMTQIELRIKFENNYKAISEATHQLMQAYEDGKGFNMELSDNIDKMEAAFKRLFWTILKKDSAYSNEGFIMNMRWELRHATYVEFFWAYERFLGRVPSWQR